VPVSYVEQVDPSGTASAIGLAREVVDERFVVLNGDVLVDESLPRALAGAHAARVRLRTPVVALQEGATGGRTDGILVELADGIRERFDRVVLTAPAGATAEIVADVAPDAAAALGGLTYNPLALVHLDADIDATGFGYQVRRSESLRTLGVSWNASLFGRDGVYTAFLGGMNDPAVLDLPEDELGGLAAREFERVMGADADVLHVEKWPDAFPAYDESWHALERVRLPESVSLATNYTARMGIPARVREARRLARRVADDTTGDGEPTDC